MEAWVMLAEGVGEHWASGGRSSRNLPGGEPRPRTVAGERGRISQQGPRPGEVAAARETGGWGISTPQCLVQTSLSLGKAWEGEDKDHLAKQDAISTLPSHRGVRAREETGREGPSQDSNQDSWLPLQCSFQPFWLHSSGPGTVGSRVCGHWQGSVPEPGRKRPAPALRPWSHLCHQGLVGPKW